jgi:lipoate-protein ligase A
LRPGAGPSWRVERRQGQPRLLLDQSLRSLRSLPTPSGTHPAGNRLARILQIDQPAVILGSGQPETDIDPDAAARAGVQLVRRSTGGGAVLVEPDAVVWIDLIIAAGDPLWDADVRRATWWVGEAWAAALDQIGAGPARVWRGGMHPSDWSKQVCFGGLGPGEVTVGGRKVVGLSQRRTRPGVLFQTAALLRWDPAALAYLLAVDEEARAGAARGLGDMAVGIGPERADALTGALLTALPDSAVTA